MFKTKLMKVKNNKEFQRVVCERDNYICQLCGKCYNHPIYFNEKGVNQYVCAHHVKTKKAFPELRLETDNGLCVDNEHHKEAHNGKIPASYVKQKLYEATTKNDKLSL